MRRLSATAGSDDDALIDDIKQMLSDAHTKGGSAKVKQLVAEIKGVVDPYLGKTTMDV
jgi:hypothetical protein